MILRCTEPRKRDRLRECGQFVGALPSGAHVLRTLRHSSHADPEHFVLRCACGALYEVRPPLERAKHLAA